jgi:dTDP-4-amino-4,6-dideoxygalactose transaminase
LSARDRLEARLASENGRAACVVAGNATTAIWAALRAIEEQRGTGEVVVPTITCPAVVQAVLYAGFTPVFVDVDLPEGTLSIGALEPLLGERTRAIVAIHIFGHAAPIAAVVERARRAAIAVIEDAAQATGGALFGRPLGSYGDFSVHSFGAGKIADAGGGGALLTDDRDVAARARELIAALPEQTEPDAELLALSQRNLFHALMDLLRVQPDAPVATAFNALIARYRTTLLRSLPAESPLVERITSRLDGLRANLEHRLRLAERYDAGLERSRAARPLSWRETGTIWRYAFLAPDPGAAIAATRALRDAGLPASNHYWSVAQLARDERLPGSTELSRRVVNLWVDEATRSADADRAIAILRGVLA